MAYTDIRSEDRLVQANFATQVAACGYDTGMAYPFGQQILLEHT